MANKWDNKSPESEWAQKASNLEIVDRFQREVFGTSRTHLELGRSIRDARKRLYRILIAGLEKIGDSRSGCYDCGRAYGHEHGMNLDRRIENIELAIEGRNNNSAPIREMIRGVTRKVRPTEDGSCA